MEVEFATGEEATAARLLNQPFRKHARTGMPLVTLKLAMSLDGQTETPAGDSPWISSAESQELVHRWRAESDAIAVGIGTVLADDPLLTARPDPSGVRNPPIEAIAHTRTGLRQPLRVVFDRQARIPLDSQLLHTLDQAPVLVIVSQDADSTRIAALRDTGAETTVADGISSALAELGRRQITSLFLEGGRTLAAAFQASDAIDEARTFVAPIFLGAPEGEGGGVPAAQQRPLFRPDPALGRPPNSEAKNPASSRDTPTLPPNTETEKISNDVLITARLKEW